MSRQTRNAGSKKTAATAGINDEGVVELQFMLNTLATLDKFLIRLGDLLVMDIDGTALPETVVRSNQPDVRLQELVCVGMGADRFYHRPIFYNG